MPPFDPRRVVSQLYYRSETPGSFSYSLTSAAPLHIEQAGGDSYRRRLPQFSQSGLFLWYSGETKAIDQACIMLYQIDADGTSDWYSSFTKSDRWKLHKVHGISRRALEDMMQPVATGI
jgi:hypothetical protein